LQRDERRAELLSAAVDMLRRDAAASVRVEDITRSAGTAKGNFYRYFSSVDDLLVAVRDHVLDQYIAAASERRARDTDPDWWQVIEDETRRFLDYQRDLGALHDVLFHSAATATTPIAPERSAGRLVAELIRSGKEHGAFVVDDAETLGELLFHTVHGAADAIRDGASRARVERAVLELLRRALGLERSP
jgi:AcrR family transcriptional regulator